MKNIRNLLMMPSFLLKLIFDIISFDNVMNFIFKHIFFFQICLQAVKQFIDLLNSSPQHQNKKQISSTTAIQYLYARKFDIPKAVALYEANHSTRQREGLYGFNASVDPLLTELETGKFTILVSRADKYELNFI
jgi:hypothetical protein